MSKIIDSFLFFQELDLLEIRLNYLDPYVDEFVIVEACQTFTGKPKDFVFEKNIERFKRFLPKINYYKIEDFHQDFESIQQYLSGFNDESHSKVLSILENHSHYPKSQIHWVLDSYHRECLHLILDRVANDDIVMISDLDEVPSAKAFQEENLKRYKQEPVVFQQAEFRYFLNYYKDSDWLGTIASKYQLIRDHSFNLLRMDSKEVRSLVAKDSLKDGGYHFTSCGGIEMIKAKIESWGHQEFNNSLILKNLEENIKTGQDIFMREMGTNLSYVGLNDREFFDESMELILLKYPSLLAKGEIQNTKINFFEKLYKKVRLILSKIQYKLSLMIRN
jgi:beta-1,4-mannosyl-glycoprotein beta-1,4-N-acetylglucosaminyltransferase